jgi:hypothetical protein
MSRKGLVRLAPNRQLRPLADSRGPCDITDMQQAIDATKIGEGTIDGKTSHLTSHDVTALRQ